jgi:hypothetical protein
MAKRTAPAHDTASARAIKHPPMPTPAPHRAQRRHEPVTQQRHPRLSQQKPIVIPRRAALSRAAAGRRDFLGIPLGR